MRWCVVFGWQEHDECRLHDWFYLRLLQRRQRATWRRSQYTTCSWIQPTSARFCVVLGSRIFQNAKANRSPRRSLKVRQAIYRSLFIIINSITLSDRLVNTFISIHVVCCVVIMEPFVPKERLLWAFFASVRITHMAQVLHKANAFCCVFVWHICCHCTLALPMSSEQSCHSTPHGHKIESLI